MLKLLKFLFGKQKPPKYRCTYCGREFDYSYMPEICHDLDIKIRRYGKEEIDKQKEKAFAEYKQ